MPSGAGPYFYTRLFFYCSYECLERCPDCGHLLAPFEVLAEELELSDDLDALNGEAQHSGDTCYSSKASTALYGKIYKAILKTENMTLRG